MNLYTSSRYLKKNPTYHSEDSLYKYNNFIKILKKNNFTFKKVKKIIDIGCGVGEILKYLKKINYFLGQILLGTMLTNTLSKLLKKIRV
jgi:2-polyprenyl-3-methyl-5-hydroxy-6-metoxy-1,4-benzoquinol methylase